MVNSKAVYLYARRTFSLRTLRRADPFLIVLLLFLTLLAVIMLLPIIYLFNHALKPFHELFLFPPNLIARNPTLQNFVELFTISEDAYIPVSRYVFNSIIVTMLATGGMITTSALCAYPLSKHKFPGRTVLFSVIVVSLLFVAEVLTIPRYVVVSNLGIMNSYWGHLLPIVSLPVGVFLLKQFVDQVPAEIMDAAKIDGASEFGIFARVVLPIVSPALATVGILAFQLAWNNVETSSLFMQDEAMKTLAFYMTSLTSNLSNSVARQGAAAAGGLILFVPQLVVFLIFQHKVIATMAHSGIK
ncbi:carbohydrate ABC transporter permease [Cohnella yongneupensis]|uniref:Carbohydrate ABC transporter permease n=1 Tax=Cohnella yongneupensis TaxID=425006 RepID=A0ABW0R031_9BACL